MCPNLWCTNSIGIALLSSWAFVGRPTLLRLEGNAVKNGLLFLTMGHVNFWSCQDNVMNPLLICSELPWDENAGTKSYVSYGKEQQPIFHCSSANLKSVGLTTNAQDERKAMSIELVHQILVHTRTNTLL